MSPNETQVKHITEIEEMESDKKKSFVPADEWHFHISANYFYI